MPNEAEEPTRRELNLRVFRGEPVPRVLFQPRMEPWFAWQHEFGTTPEPYAEMSLLDFYDELDLSMRYVHYYTGMPDPVQRHYEDEVRVRHEPAPDGSGDGLTVWQTPHGELVQRAHRTVDKTWRTVGFAVKTLRDLRGLKWLTERTRYTFSAEDFARGSAFIAERGEPQFWVPKSPYQALCQVWMKLDDFIYALADAPEEVEEVMAAIDRAYDPLYEGIIASGQVSIVNFGENIHDHLLSPRYFARYLAPWYEKRSGQLRGAGIFTHVHIDGYFHSLLPQLAALPFDGLEALTPEPQGDVSLEEMAENIGDKVLLDGIPAIYFTPTYPLERLAECVERIVELFHPRLVLGISDEIPEGAGEREIEKVRWVSDYCRRTAGEV